MKPKRKKRRFFRWIVLFLVIAGGAAAAFYPRKADVTEVRTGKAEVRDITSVVSATGKIFPQVEVRITSEVAGEIIELPVREGQFVQKGDKLVRVDPELLKNQVLQQEAAIQSARARAAQNRVALERAQQVFSDNEALFAKEFIAEDVLRRVRTDMLAAEAAHQASLAQVQQQEMQLAQARETLDKATLYAPMDGTISSISAELGERVVGTGQFAGTEIMRIADFANMELRIDVAETDIVNVAVGNRAKITIDAMGDESFEGEVTEIAASAATSGANSQEQATTFQVKIRLTRLDDRIRPGMTANADIETQTASQVIAVPLQAVTVRERKDVRAALAPKDASAEGPREGERPNRENRSGGSPREEGQRDSEKARRERLQRVVFVVEDGIARLRPVETGIADNAWMEITSGLEAGTPIVTGPYGTLTRELKHDQAVKEATEGPGRRGAPGGRPQ
jgi:HlyD family secretion protein